ncbi:sperm motility kinase X-like [Acomys russatus]|uniref:sperm motility kinase X-like n=1 Tax=Acomys russatus TaxID=60746 RepID=UPI0021E339E9|nr:sperm motility kinase X-like [Acomys russatus]
MKNWRWINDIGLDGFDDLTITEHYNFIRTLGTGSYGDVKLASHRLTQNEVAVKLLPKGKMDTTLMSEIEILKSVDHPNIIKLLHLIETAKHTYIIMEYASGGELLDKILAFGYLPEKESCRLFTQVGCAIHYCHRKGIAHRDIKPENILVDSKGNIKLCDFGFSAKVTTGQRLKDRCGTLPYCAPELFKGEAYDAFSIDIWSLGVLLYLMSTGYLPFYGHTRARTKRKIMVGTYSKKFNLSPELWEVITNLLTVNPGQRPRIGDLMNFAWLKHGGEGSPSSFSNNSADSHPDPNVMVTMGALGYKPCEIKKSLQEKKFDEVMATYLILRQQSPCGGHFIKKVKPRQSNLQETTLKRASSVPSLTQSSYPTPENVRNCRRRISMPPILNFLNMSETPVLPIRLVSVQEDSVMSVIWADTNIYNAYIVRQSSTSSQCLGMYSSQSSLDEFKACSRTYENKLSSQSITSHHVPVEEGQCKIINIPPEKISSSVPQASPQEDRSGQPYEVTLAGTENGNTSKENSFSISNEEAQDEGVQKEPSSPETTPGRSQLPAPDCTKSTLQKRIWKTLRRGFLRGMGGLFCCVTGEKRERLANRKVLARS